METLDDIGRRHLTDNSSLCHDYLRHLEPYLEPFRQKISKTLWPMNVLELGVAGGNSLRTWSDYFQAAEILGVDHSPSVKNLDVFPVRTLLADVTFDEGGWNRIREYLQKANMLPIHFCFDDASHAVWATYQAFLKGWPLLAPGALWVISDCHASFDPAYRRDNVPNGLPEHFTIMDCILDLSRRRLHELGDSQCGKYTTVESDIESITYFKSLIAIRKRATTGAEE